MSDIPVNLVVALPAEAKPVIRHFGLQRWQPDGDFPVYRNGPLCLVLSGVGKAASAAAVAFLNARRSEAGRSIWLNLGIAGHGRQAVGEALLASRITDGETHQSWGVCITFEPPCDTTCLLSLDRPHDHYPSNCATDMESTGFVSAALRHSPPQLVHCLKIVSDNPASPAQNINARLVSDLIANRLTIVSLLIERLQAVTANQD